MDRHVWQKSIDFVCRTDNETISIGGGEPTLHPDFFEILQSCVQSFDYVWMATNGSRTKTMKRLAQILDGEEDYDEVGEEGIYLTRKDQLSVALSTDYFHAPIDREIETFWKRRAEMRGGGFEIRDITTSTNGPIAVGRAKKTQSGWATGCVCSDLMILPSGKIKLCGCPKSPIIGDVIFGIEEKWKEYMNTEEYLGYNCYFGNKKKGEHI